MLSEKQRYFNEKKWLDSIKNGKDMCGEYDFCCKCDKTKENPCDMAYQAFTKMSKTCRAKAKAKFKANGKEVIFRSTILEK